MFAGSSIALQRPLAAGRAAPAAVERFGHAGGDDLLLLADIDAPGRTQRRRSAISMPSARPACARCSRLASRSATRDFAVAMTSVRSLIVMHAGSASVIVHQALRLSCSKIETRSPITTGEIGSSVRSGTTLFDAGATAVAFVAGATLATAEYERNP